MLQDPSIIKTAYNAAFEITCLSKHFNLDLDPAQWHCTMVQAASLGLPKSLAGAAKALGRDKKMEEGRDLIRYFCQPLPTDGYQWRAEPETCRSMPKEANGPRSLNTAARTSSWSGPCVSRWPTTPSTQLKQTAWEMDQRINRRGVLTDRDLVRQARALSEAHTEELMQGKHQDLRPDKPQQRGAA